jgi:hypothetical protein
VLLLLAGTCIPTSRRTCGADAPPPRRLLLPGRERGGHSAVRISLRAASYTKSR